MPICMEYNPNYPSYPSDCTNFVSQTMAAGGEPEIGIAQPVYGADGSSSDPSYWYMIPLNQRNSYATNAMFTQTWTVVQWWLYFNLYGSNQSTQRAKIIGSFYYDKGNNTAPANPPYMVPGDVFAYNFTGNSYNGLSHLSIETQDGNFTDQYGYVGDAVDAHTNNRHNIFWTLKDVSPGWATMSIFYIQIQPFAP